MKYLRLFESFENIYMKSVKKYSIKDWLNLYKNI